MARHVLVVDDDDDVRNVILAMLVASGFEATAATGGVAMRDILATHGAPIDVIVLDSAMPGEQGESLALYAKALRIPVIMISGSPDCVKFAEEQGLQLLRKPFRMAQLRRAIEDALGSGQFGQRDA